MIPGGWIHRQKKLFRRIIKMDTDSDNNTRKTSDTGVSIHAERPVFAGSMLLFGIAAILSSLMGFAGISFHLTLLSSLYPGDKTLAFSAGICYIILGLILVFLALRADRGHARTFVGGILAGIIILESIEFPLNIAGDHSIMEKLAIPAGNLILGQPTTPISPVASALIAAAALALLFLILTTDKQEKFRYIRDISGMIGLAVILTGFTLLLSYIIGAPLLHGTNYLPISFPGIIAAFFLGFGIMAAAGPGAIPLRYFTGSSMRARLLRTFLPLTLVILFGNEVITVLSSAPGTIPAALLFSASIVIFSLVTACVVFLVSHGLGEIIEEEMRKRREAEETIKTSEQRYRSLFETAQDGILILDGETGEVIDANKFILEKLGYPLDYFVGKHLWELGFIKDKSLAQKAFTELKKSGYIRYEDIPLETRDGWRMDVEFISNAYLVGEKKIIQCNIRDITERKRAESALFSANKKLNILSSVTRHDINNQLTAIQGYLGLYHQECKGDEKVRGYYDRLMKSVNLIERQITFTKLYQDLGVKAPVWQRVEDVISNAKVGFGEIRFIVGTGSMEIFTDILLEKVFFNLFDNAIRYGEHVTEICITSDHRDGGCIIMVEDNGVGVLLDEKEHIFERGVGKNTGLGLFLVREILAITGITIRESGEPGHGARFEIFIPKESCRF